MAYIGMQFDASQVEPSTSFDVIPAGKYHVQIVNSEMRPTKSGTGRYLWLELSIMDGPHANKRLFERLNLENQNEKAVEIAQRKLGDICRAIGQMSLSDSEQLHNRSLLTNVKVRPEGVDNSGVMRPASNEIGGYEPLGGRPAMQAVAPAAVAAQPVSVAAQAPSEAPKASTPPWRRTTAA